MQQYCRLGSKVCCFFCMTTQMRVFHPRQYSRFADTLHELLLTMVRHLLCQYTLAPLWFAFHSQTQHLLHELHQLASQEPALYFGTSNSVT